MDDLKNITAKKIDECAKSGKEDALKVYDICGRVLGKGLSMVLESVFSRSRELLTKAMFQELQKECLPCALAACKIIPTELGESLGGFCVAFSGNKWRKNNERIIEQVSSTFIL